LTGWILIKNQLDNPVTDVAALNSANADRWTQARLTRSPEFSPVAQRLCTPAVKQRYLTVSSRTGVPWFVAAVIHERDELGARHRAGRPLGREVDPRPDLPRAVQVLGRRGR
jgi:lysozyme family protein